MTVFGKDLLHALVLGFALGSAVMAMSFGVLPVQAAPSMQASR